MLSPPRGFSPRADPRSTAPTSPWGLRGHDAHTRASAVRGHTGHVLVSRGRCSPSPPPACRRGPEMIPAPGRRRRRRAPSRELSALRQFIPRSRRPSGGDRDEPEAFTSGLRENFTSQPGFVSRPPGGAVPRPAEAPATIPEGKLATPSLRRKSTELMVAGVDDRDDCGACGERESRRTETATLEH